jgi:hypothetical protein
MMPPWEALAYMADNPREGRMAILKGLFAGVVVAGLILYAVASLC